MLIAAFAVPAFFDSSSPPSKVSLFFRTVTRVLFLRQRILDPRHVVRVGGQAHRPPPPSVGHSADALSLASFPEMAWSSYRQ